MRRHLFVALAICACSPYFISMNKADAQSAPANVDEKRLTRADGDSANWMSYGRTYSEQRFSPLNEINRENLNNLNLTWHADLDTERGQEATPIVVDGVMYVSTAWSKVFALDATTGKQLWAFDPKVPGEWAVHACCDVVNRGVAVWEGKVFVGTIDGRLIALDSVSGKPLWDVLTIDRSLPYTITGAPRVVKGKVLIGNGGSEMGVRGYVTAYDATTGKQAWRFYTVPGDPSKPFENPALADAAKTWAGEWWKFGGGGTVYDAMAYDPDLDLLYIGVGNGGPWNHQVRSQGKGDNLFLSSIVALRPDTGDYVWHYQTTPGDTWDFTATQHMVLADIAFDGATRKVLMQAPKNGFFYVLDRTNGKLISAEKYVPLNWATGVDKVTGRPIEVPEARWGTDPSKVFMSLPGPLGAHNWQPMSFNPRTGLVYIPAFVAGFPFKADTTLVENRKQGFNVGVDGRIVVLPLDRKARAQAKADNYGELLAWDPVKQAVVWSKRYKGPWNGGVLSTASNLVFQGTHEGQLIAYDAANGDQLWSKPTQTAVMAPPISYSVKGKQYIAVLVGFGGAFGLTAGELAVGTFPKENRPRLLAFSIGGQDSLPPPAAEPVASVVKPPQRVGTPEMIANGNMDYHVYCVACHGLGAVGGGVVPDLRLSNAVGDADSFNLIVRDGALGSRGMASFGAVLSKDRTEAIRSYIIDRANTPIPEP